MYPAQLVPMARLVLPNGRVVSRTKGADREVGRSLPLACGGYGGLEEVHTVGGCERVADPVVARTSPPSRCRLGLDGRLVI